MWKEEFIVELHVCTIQIFDTSDLKKSKKEPCAGTVAAKGKDLYTDLSEDKARASPFSRKSYKMH
jgi:hypothetical protein